MTDVKLELAYSKETKNKKFRFRIFWDFGRKYNLSDYVVFVYTDTEMYLMEDTFNDLKESIIAVEDAIKRINVDKVEEIKITDLIKKELTNGILTENESKVLTWLLEHGYYAEKGYSDVTVNDISVHTKIEMRSLRGVISSLIKKGYIWLEETDTDDKFVIIYATDKLYELDDDEERWTQ